MSSTPDVQVIGGGAIGVATACFLRQIDAAVDRLRPDIGLRRQGYLFIVPPSRDAPRGLAMGTSR